MSPPILTAGNLGLNFGERVIFRNLDFSIQTGEHICLVGRNGSGKSTLLKVMAGLVTHDEGDLFIQPGTRISFLHQEPDFSPYADLREYVRDGLPEDQKHEDWRIDAVLSRWELTPEMAPLSLSGGEKRRAGLARVLAGEPDVLLLDEPTNHLDLPTIEQLEKELKSFRGCLVLISHDRAFLRNLTDVTLWLDRGVLRRLDKGYEHYDAWAELVLEHEERERAKMDKLIAQETTWSHQGITARRKRNQGRLRRLYELREKRSGMITSQGRAKLEVDSGSISGKLIAEVKNISINYSDRPIIRNFSTRIVRGDRIGIIGPNGAGKSTLLRLLTGQILPDTGHIRIGKNLTPVYFDQSRQALDPETTLWDTLCERGTDQIIVRGHPRHVVSYLRDFLFDAGQARSPVKSLSGGEKSRLLLAKTMAMPSNLLILDEPTNDLDMDTLDLLQEMLDEYDGTLILVSHDRSFLDQLVTSTIVFEGQGELVEYAGGYTDYLHQHRLRKPLPEKPTQSTKPDKVVAETANHAPSRPSGRLTYKLQRRYEEIPGLLELLEKRFRGIESELGSPDVIHKTPNELKTLGDEHRKLQAEIESLEMEWLEIEELRSKT